MHFDDLDNSWNLSDDDINEFISDKQENSIQEKVPNLKFIPNFKGKILLKR